MKLLALYQNKEQFSWLQELQVQFSDLYQIDLASSQGDMENISKHYQALITWEDVDCPIPYLNLKDLDLLNPKRPRNYLKLARRLIELERQIDKRILEAFPYHASLTDLDGQILHSNGKPLDPFDFNPDTDYPISKWVLDQIKDSPSQSCHLTIPSPAFDQILIHSHQICKDKNGEPNGIFQYVQDIKPILENYLEETGQALVGWSDVTSGASIHNDTFNYD